MGLGTSLGLDSEPPSVLVALSGKRNSQGSEMWSLMCGKRGTQEFQDLFGDQGTAEIGE